MLTQELLATIDVVVVACLIHVRVLIFIMLYLHTCPIDLNLHWVRASAITIVVATIVCRYNCVVLVVAALAQACQPRTADPTAET